MLIDQKKNKNIHMLRPIYVPVSNTIRGVFGTQGIFLHMQICSEITQ